MLQIYSIDQIDLVVQRIIPRLDARGRPVRTACCPGNLVPLHSKSQPRIPIGLLNETAGFAPGDLDCGICRHSWELPDRMPTDAARFGPVGFISGAATTD